MVSTTSKPPPHSRFFDPAPESRSLDKFGWLLILTYGTIAAQSLVNIEESFAGIGQELANLVAVSVSSAMMVLAMEASGVARRWRQLLWILIALALAVHIPPILEYLTTGASTSVRVTTIPVGPVLLSLITFYVVIHRLAGHRRITASTLLGAITAYLMIPLAFYYVFLAVDGLSKTPFFGRPAVGQEFMFFSLTTVTTLGYGNPLPVSDLGQLLATTEALIGQLYLVVVVALIVGLMASRWQSESTRAQDQ